MPPEWMGGWPVDWPAPARVRAVMTTRDGGVSQGSYASLNLGLHVGDDPVSVAENRARLETAMRAPVRWLNQVHGNHVVDIGTSAGSASVTADAAITTRAGVACAVLVADCLPVLFCNEAGDAVAAAHAGWRGLASGVLENTVKALCVATSGMPSQLHAWLGPCIGPRQFEVGLDVLQAFGCVPQHDETPRFVPRTRADGSAAWLCDLAGLARDRLNEAGVKSIHGAPACTHERESDFFSFRRQRTTGAWLPLSPLTPEASSASRCRLRRRSGVPMM